MKSSPLILRWLAVAALSDWLISRTIARTAIFIPKTALLTTAYQWISFAGQVAATLAALLALASLGWLAWRCWRAGQERAWSLAWAALLGLGLFFLVLAPTGWWAAGQAALKVTLLSALGLKVARGRSPRREKVSIVLPGLALGLSELYHLAPAVYEGLHWPGPPPVSGLLFNIGELLAVVSPIALWWAHGRGASRRAWIAGLLPALVFVALRFANPAMTGTIAIWSIGLSLYLPWPLYALSLWLASVAVISALQHGNPAGWAILLLTAGGYAPQLSVHAYLGLIAVWWLGSLQPQAAPTSQPQASASTGQAHLAPSSV